MRFDVEFHPTEDELEKYLLNHTTGFEMAAIEEHLLVCGSCQTALEDAEAVVLAMRSACRQLLREQAAAPRRWWQIRIPMAAYAGSFAVLITVFSLGYVYRAPATMPESELVLTAMRSGAAPHSMFARAGSTVLLHLDATALPSRAPYVVEVVDQSGGRIWSGGAAVVRNAVTVKVGERLEAGRYWVRLNNSSGVELREFELDVR
jgi:hypothetical protein